MIEPPIARPLPIAYHEAGHAAVAFICRVPFSAIWIAPEQDPGGWTGIPAPPTSCANDDHRALIGRHILVLLGGRVAEIRSRPPNTLPYHSEIDQREAEEWCRRLHGDRYASALSTLQARVEGWFDTPKVWAAVESLANTLWAELKGKATKASLSGETATSILAGHIPISLRLPVVMEAMFCSRFCSGCGRKLESDWFVCPCCAKPVQAVSSEAPVGQSKQEVKCVSRGMGRGTLIVVILAPLVLLLMGSVGSMSLEKLIALGIVALAYGLVGVLFWVLIVGGLKSSGKGEK